MAHPPGQGRDRRERREAGGGGNRNAEWSAAEWSILGGARRSLRRRMGHGTMVRRERRNKLSTYAEGSVWLRWNRNQTQYSMKKQDTRDHRMAASHVAVAGGRVEHVIPALPEDRCPPSEPDVRLSPHPALHFRSCKGKAIVRERAPVKIDVAGPAEYQRLATTGTHKPLPA